uniref:Ig-like domain-containing protein n=1 Tax=Esox lucius TaxID=8010 RepID=A0A3P8ZKT7_ESOLU
MSLVITLLFLAIPCACNGKSEKFVELDCKQEVSGVNGQQSLLECIVKCREDDLTIIGVNWKKMGTDLLNFHNGTMDVSPGFQFAVPGWNKSSNVSLLLTNTKMEDMGEYECKVLTDRGQNENTVSLSVIEIETHQTRQHSSSLQLSNFENVSPEESRDIPKAPPDPSSRLPVGVIVVILALILFFTLYFSRSRFRQRPCVYARSPTSAT